MVWIKADSTLGYSRKLDQAREALGLTRTDMVGKLVFLWWWVAEKAPDGNLPKLTDVEIATIAWYDPAHAGAFVLALLNAGFLERTGDGLRIHDWEQWIAEPTYDKLRHERRKKTEDSPEKNRTSPTSAQSSSPVVLVFPVSGTTKSWELREDNLKKLQELYPATDALAVCKKALFWVENNPKNKKTAPRMLQWLGSVWLDREQNRAKGSGVKSPEAEKAENREIQDRIRREREQQQKRLDDYKRSGKQRPG